mgnify:CR=1 FL=1
MNDDYSRLIKKCEVLLDVYIIISFAILPLICLSISVLLNEIKLFICLLLIELFPAVVVLIIIEIQIAKLGTMRKLDMFLSNQNNINNFEQKEEKNVALFENKNS